MWQRSDLPLVLGSTSFSRKAVLAAAIYPETFDTYSPDIDEGAIKHDNPLTLPSLIAKAKAEELLPLLAGKYPNGCILVTSDQIVLTADNKVTGKPSDEAEAIQFLRGISGSFARTVSAVCVVNTRTSEWYEGVDVTQLDFAPYNEEELQAALVPKHGVPISQLLPKIVEKHDGTIDLENVFAPNFIFGSEPWHGEYPIPKWVGQGEVESPVENSAPTYIADIRRCAGALCVEHPVQFGKLLKMDGGVDCPFGLPWKLTSSLLIKAGLWEH